MKIITLLLSISILSLNSCSGQRNDNEELKLKDFKFESIFGSIDSEPDNMYCLLGTGFFRTPRSDNSDSLINTWIKNHPQATFIPVSSFGPVETKNPDSKMTYCWVIDQKDTLNNYLIRNGCFPGGTMMRAKESKNIVRKKEYEAFIEQIKSAELYARKMELGVWTKEEEK
jgi:hypothetical protein